MPVPAAHANAEINRCGLGIRLACCPGTLVRGGAVTIAFHNVAGREASIYQEVPGR